MQTTPKAIIFDLDNTLIDSDLLYEKALRSLQAKDFSLAAASGTLKQTVISLKMPEYIEARHRVKMRLPEGHTSARNRLLYFKSMLEASQKSAKGARIHREGISPQLCLQIMKKYEAALLTEARRQVKALKREKLLRELNRRGYSLFILSNENLRTQLIKMMALDPQGRYFRRILVSEEVGVEKPHRKIFSTLLADEGLRPQDCLFVGDDQLADIAGAQKAGLSALLTTEFTANTKRKNNFECTDSANSQINRLDQLLKFLPG